MKASVNPFYYQGPVEKLRSKSAQKFKIGIRLGISNQGLIDPDQFSNRDHDRGEMFSIRIRLKNYNQSLPGNFKSRSG
ncbi:MAG: hypothetical protein Q7T80_07720 [Methanoregula sp.]|nr:hypothetical protein [Methanoregula sp.]